MVLGIISKKINARKVIARAEQDLKKSKSINLARYSGIKSLDT